MTWVLGILLHWGDMNGARRCQQAGADREVSLQRKVAPPLPRGAHACLTGS